MYAVVATGGKQYKVAVGDRLRVETLPGEVGAKLQLTPVLFVGGDKEVKVGTPHLEQAQVTAEVIRHARAKKIKIIRKKRRKGYRKKIGHRQSFTEVKIVKIEV